MTQLELVLKDRGISKACEDKDYWLHKARAVAYQIAREKGYVSIDDVREACPLPAGNWMGGVFRGKGWRFKGYEKARHAGSHARTITVWELAA